MQQPGLLSTFFQKNKMGLLATFLVNGLMLWFSYSRLVGENIQSRVEFHNMVLLGNFMSGLWMCWKMEWRLPDYRNAISPLAPMDAKPLGLIFAIGLPLFVGCMNMFIFMPAYVWLESAHSFSVFMPKLVSAIICGLCFISIFASGWAMNLNNREQFEAQNEPHLGLALYRSFIDFYFYYMMLACGGLILYKIFGDEVQKNFAHFKLLDVAFCFLAAGLMMFKAVYELSTKNAFLWGKGQQWSVDLPAGIIKVLTVSIFAWLAPIPDESKMALDKKTPLDEVHVGDLPRVQDPEVPVDSQRLPASDVDRRKRDPEYK